uniref:Uncharacterized protein n=1 Tax=Arundo donax TaxID=35708 RepID=A0A0A8YWR1_ARUDO
MNKFSDGMEQLKKATQLLKYGSLYSNNT